jgi:hypothetical protein
MPENLLESSAQVSLEEAASNQEPLYVHLAITDPDVRSAILEYSAGASRTDFMLTALKIGVLSLRAAQGVVDGNAIRSAGDHLIDQLSERLNGYRTALEDRVGQALAHYFDPQSGLFPTRVEHLVKDGGELSTVIKQQVGSAQAELHQVFEKFLGENSLFFNLLAPSESNQLLAALRSTVDEVAQAEKTAILTQFSLDEPNSALSRLVRELTQTHGEMTGALKTQMNDVISEFSLDRPDSALSRLVGRVEAAQRSIASEFSLDNTDSALSRMRSGLQNQIEALATAQTEFQKEVIGILSSMQARKEAENRSTTHGMVFEEKLGVRLEELAGPAGDVLEACGTTTGQIRNSKVGDYVLTLSPDSAGAGARIVVEAKQSSAYNLKSTLEEADEARRNRSAGICLFVHSKRTAPSGLSGLAKYGHDIVVVWDEDDPGTDVILQAGFLTAKALSIRVAQRDKQEAASQLKIDKAIEAIRKQINGFDEIRTTSETIQNGTSRILERIRIMHADLVKQVNILAENVDGLLKEED